MDGDGGWGMDERGWRMEDGGGRRKIGGGMEGGLLYADGPAGSAGEALKGRGGIGRIRCYGICKIAKGISNPYLSKANKEELFVCQV